MSVDQASGTDSDSGSSDQQLDEAIVEFLRLSESGAPVDIPAFLQKHVSVADKLQEFINHQLQFGRITTPVRRIAELSKPSDKSELADFGDYEIVGEIGRGGMGIIFEARQKGLKRHVALKMIREGQFSTGEDLVRFQAEAEAAAALEHPNIVPVYRVGNVDGRPFFTMKLVRGGSLKEELADGPMDHKEAARIASLIAGAVSFAHQRGILHRDLKPANILLDHGLRSSSGSSSGSASDSDSSNEMTASDASGASVTPLISDFGLAKQLNSDDGLTLTGTILGTPSFMPPEQALGKGELTTAADVYGVGAILFNMLTGKPPFTGNGPADITRKVIDQRPMLPSGIPYVELDLKTICFKCLEKSPADRYASAGELAEDLNRYLSGRSIQARPTGTLEQFVRWARRNRYLAASLATVAALLVLTCVGSVLFSIRLNKESAKRAEQRDHAIRRLFESKSAEVSARRSSGESGQRFGAIAAAAEAVAQLESISATPEEIFDLRSETAGCLGNIDLMEIASWDPSGQASYGNIAMSPDLDLVAYHAKENDPVSIYRTSELQQVGSVDAATPIATIEVGDGLISGPHRCRFSDCGTWLTVNCYHNRTTMQTVYDVHENRILFQEEGVLNGCVGYPDGSPHLATADRNTITIRRLPDLEEVVSFKNPTPGSNNLLKFSPNGKWLARYGSSGVSVFDVPSGEIVSVIDQSTLPLAWHPDEPEIAISKNTEVEVWRLDGTSPTRVASFPQHTEYVFNLNFTPDGTALASTTWEQTTQLWDLRNGELLFSFAGTINCFSSDGLRVGFQNARSGICEFESRRFRKTISRADPKHMASQPLNLDVHPNHRWVVMGDKNSVRICDLRSGEKLMDIPGPGWVQFHPDGESLLVGDSTIAKWALRDEQLADGERKLIIGPPETVYQGEVSRGIDIDPDGSHLAFISGGRTLVRNLNSSQTVAMKSSRAATGVSICRGARLVAVGNHHDSGAHVFDGATGELLHSVETPGNARATLSPDGDILAVTFDNTAEVYDTRQWKLLYSLMDSNIEVAWPTSFSDDGRCLLFALRKPSSTLIVDARTGEKLIRIPGAAGTISRVRPALTPEQTLVRIRDGNSIESWDVANIRKELGTIGLDWEEEGSGAFVVVPDSLEYELPPAVEVEWGQSRATTFSSALRRVGRFGGDAAEQAIAIWHDEHPDDADLCLAHGRYLVDRNDPESINYLDKAIALAPRKAEAYFYRAKAGKLFHRQQHVISDLETCAELGMESADLEQQLDQRLAWEVLLGHEKSELSDSQLKTSLAQASRFHTSVTAADALRWVTSTKRNDRPTNAQVAMRVLAHKTLGLALLGNDKPDAAIMVLNLAAPSQTKTFSNGTFGIEFLLAQAFARKGQMDEAKRHFQFELENRSRHGTIYANDASDWCQLKTQTESALAMEDKPNLQWSPIELAACSSWETGGLQVQYFPRSNRFTDLESNEFETTNLGVENLYWRSDRKSQLSFDLQVPEEGIYDGRISLCRSWDYGLLEFTINGQKIEGQFDGQFNEVVFGDGVDFEGIKLRQGTNTLVVKIAGRSPKSKGMCVGIEFLEFSRQ